MSAQRRAMAFVPAVALAFTWAFTAQPAAAEATSQPASALHRLAAEQAALPPAPLLPRTAFMDDGMLADVRLSPDGSQVADLRAGAVGASFKSLWLTPTTGGPARLLLARTQAERIAWSRNGQWLFLSGDGALEVVAATPGARGAGLRLPLGGALARQWMKLDPSQPAAAILREQVREGGRTQWRIVRVTARGERTLLIESARWVHDVALDAQGALVAMTRFEGSHDALLRKGADGRWREALRLAPLQRIALLAASADGSLMLQGNPEGGDLARLLRMDAHDALHTVHQDPRGEADLADAVINPLTGEPLAASYRSTIAASWGIGAAQGTVARITRQLAGQDITLQAPASASAPWLVAERGATLREPRWHLFDPHSGTLRRLLDAPALAPGVLLPQHLATKLAVSYRASDGVLVHGFVLLPPGVDAAHAPLIVQVHGGPLNHFRTGFDGVAQFLANRGHVVFQSNFRGSTGHGRAYTFAPQGDYGGQGRVQQDITEGVRWLLAQGVGDGARVGIVGHSFGGYSVLAGLTFEPGLYKVGVAGAPPPDLGWGMRWLMQAGDQGAQPDRSLQRSLSALGLDTSQAAAFARLHAASPLAHAAQMHRPLLIFAGGADRTVPLQSITHYAALLRLQRADVSLVVDPQGGHSPSDRLAREAYLYTLEATLAKHLGGRPTLPASAKLKAWLAQNTRLGAAEIKAATAPALPGTDDHR